MNEIATFLMFVGEQCGKAEEAMNLYVSTFEDAEIRGIERHAAGGDDVEGTVKRGDFVLGGREFMAMDSGADHGFTFTPATSLFITCDSADEVDRLFGTLSDDGAVLMPLGEYPFSPRFGWVNDRYGVSWQLFLPLAG